MSSILKEILDWSEVWAMLIPLAFLQLCRNKTPYLRPVRIFLLVFLLLNIFQDVLWKFRKEFNLEQGDFLWNNNFIYNIGSVIRLFLFAWFFILLQQRFMHRLKNIIPFAFLAFLLVNFIFFENFIPQGMETFSSRLLATESAILLFYCLQYFIFLILDEKQTKPRQQPGFFVVVGLSIYMGANFFIFLLWEYLVSKTEDFALGIWDVHNITFIILCIFIAIQFKQEHKKYSAS